MPRYSAIGDIVLFYHAKTAIQRIRKLETSIKAIDENKYDKQLKIDWLNRARKLYSLYGGKIFAIGKIVRPPKKEEDINNDSNLFHWGSKIYAGINELVLLKQPKFPFIKHFIKHYAVATFLSKCYIFGRCGSLSSCNFFNRF